MRRQFKYLAAVLLTAAAAAFSCPIGAMAAPGTENTDAVIGQEMENAGAANADGQAAQAAADAAALAEAERVAQIENLQKEIEACYGISDPIERTLAINQKDQEMLRLRTCDFTGKKITCLGDSITVGAGGYMDENGIFTGYAQYLVQTLGCEVTALGVGSTTIGDYFIEGPFVERYLDIPADSDIIIIQGGVNDYQLFSCGLYSNFGNIKTRAAGSYCGEVYRLFSGIKERYPNADVFVLTTYRSNMEQSFPPTWKLVDFMNVQKTYAKQFGFEVIDLTDSGFLDCRQDRVAQIWSPDRVHPSPEGHVFLAQRIGSYLGYYYSTKK